MSAARMTPRPPWSARGLAAVGGEDLASHEGSRGGLKEHDGASNLVRLGHAPQWHSRGQRRLLSAVPVKRLSIPVSVGPGATALTRTPKRAASSAADFVMPSTACLLAA